MTIRPSRFAPLLLVAWLPACMLTQQEAGEAAKPEVQPRGAHVLASTLEESGEMATALAVYESAAATGDADAAVRLGEAYLRSGDGVGAERAFRLALEREPNNGPAQLGLGSAALRRGELDAALASLSKAAPVVDSAAGYNRLGIALTLAGKAPEAVAAFEKSHSRAADDLDIAANLALAEALAGRKEQAVDRIRGVARSESAKPTHRRNLALVLALAGAGNEAQSVVEANLPAAERPAFLRRLRTLESAGDMRARARIVGTILAG
jgi:Flp pilus assembly protein TadD